MNEQKEEEGGKEKDLEEKEADEGGEAAEDSRPIQRVQDPRMPSKAERGEHELTHLPYRSWCKFCVAGRGRQMDHSKGVSGSENPEFHMDFCFPGDEESGENLITLVVRESATKMLFAT